MADYSVISRGETAPPVAPEEGDQYIVAVGGSGAWVGWDNHIAHFAAAAWEEIVPANEAVAVIEDEELTVVYKGSPEYWVQQQFDRDKLSAPRTYYVRAAGSDVTGDGLTVGTAVNSISKAIDIAAALDTNNYDVTIDADETRAHASSAVLQQLFGGGSGILFGAGRDISSIAGAIALDARGLHESDGVGHWSVNNFELIGTSRSVQAAGPTFIEFGDDMKFSGTSIQIHAESNAVILLLDGYRYNASGLHHISASGGASVIIAGTVTAPGGLAFSGYFLNVSSNAVIATGATYSISAPMTTGVRFRAQTGGRIQADAIAASSIPGSVNGVIDPSGVFEGVGYVANPRRHNYAATTDPTVTDDADDYYAVGSKWTNVTLDCIFECVDATVGAAIWRPVGIKHNFAATVIPAVGDDEDDGYQVGSRWLIPTTRREFLLTDATAGAAVWQEVTTQLGRNFLHNPAFRIAQRGTSFASPVSAGVFTLDRWKASRASGATCVISRQAGFSGADYCIRLQRDAANAQTDGFRLMQQIPAVIARNMRGMPVTLSLYGRCGADWSDADAKIDANIWTGTGVDEAATLGSGFATGNVNTALTAQTLTTSAARIVFPAVVLAADLSEIAVRVTWTPAGTAGAADYTEFTMMKLEIGYDATPFIHDTEKQTLDECLFFFEKLGGGIADHHFGRGYANSTTVGRFSVLYGLKRITPALTINGTVATAFELQRQGSAVVAPTAIAATASNMSDRSAQIDVTVASGLTAGEGLGFKAKTTSGSIFVDAEI